MSDERLVNLECIFHLYTYVKISKQLKGNFIVSLENNQTLVSRFLFFCVNAMLSMHVVHFL